LDRELKFSEIIRKNHELGEVLADVQKVKLKTLSNISVHQLNPILEYSLRAEGINALVESGNYDSILQDSSSISEEIPVIFWELCNLKESFAFQAEIFSDDEIENFVEKVKNELDLLFDNLRESRIVIFNRFSHFLFSCNDIIPTRYELFTDSLNDYLARNKPSNFTLIDIDKVLAFTSLKESVSWKNYYSSKSLYTIEFYKRYSEFISPVVLSLYSKTKKALICDCDNTLWGGIVGEDGWENISVSDRDKRGIFYKEFQLILKNLAGKGIIIGLCSKNNPDDVEEVFNKRDDLSINDDDIIVKRLNWGNKAENLADIARELNIGIDSIVFVDDSSFEINLVKEKLPMVKTIQVPESLYEYPNLLLEHLPVFFNQKITSEDRLRIRMIKDDARRNETKKVFSSIDDYLASLQITSVISKNDLRNIERIAQLTQKTNQFNLSTRRYSVNEIESFCQDDSYDVFCIEVGDKFGTLGLTGVCIVRYYPDFTSEIDTLLLSCRILGRNIEFAFFSEVLKLISSRGYKSIKAKYIKTLKNQQVSDFYENCGFLLIDLSEGEKQYIVDLEAALKDIPSIKYITTEWKRD
jgi:FkbH-like protein